MKTFEIVWKKKEKSVNKNDVVVDVSVDIAVSND